MDISVQVEDLSRSLFREFLIKNSLTKTLEVFNDEEKRFRPKITKIDLIRYLSIEKLIKMNKEKVMPKNTLLEIIVDYLHGKYKQRIEKLRENNDENNNIVSGSSQKDLKNMENMEFGQFKNQSLTDVFENKEQKSKKDIVIDGKNEKIEENHKKTSLKLEKEKDNDFLSKLPDISGKSSKKQGKLAKIEKNEAEENKKIEKIIQNEEFSFDDKEKKPEKKIKEAEPKKPRTTKPGKITEIEENINKKPEKPNIFSENPEIEENIKKKSEKPNIFDKNAKTLINSEISKPKEQKDLTEELDEFDEVFNFGVKPSEVSKLSKNPEKPIKKPQEEPLFPSELLVKNKEIRMNLFNPIDLPPAIPKPDFDYLLKPKLGMKIQSKSKNLNQLDKTTREALKKLLFGDGEMKNLPKSWQQGFFFTENPNLFFGLMQKEGGPCGVLACVQAYLIKHLLFLSGKINKNDKNLMNLVRNNCLLLSLSEILFKCTQKHYRKVNLLITESNSLTLESCGIVSYEPKDVNELYSILLQNHKEDFIGQFNNGVALFLYSVILTKGVENFRAEMDLTDINIIGLHSTCTQEVVNLMLTGEATSNCIDGIREIDDNYKIRGVREKSEIGFLTILEFYNYTKVEKNYKEPVFPIWVLSTEYHYCVCFSNEFMAIDSQAKNFEVLFYDELNHPNDLIVVEIEGNKEKIEKKGKKDENIPLLDMVLSTKWGREREIVWKGYEPIF